MENPNLKKGKNSEFGSRNPCLKRLSDSDIESGGNEHDSRPGSCLAVTSRIGNFPCCNSV